MAGQSPCERLSAGQLGRKTRFFSGQRKAFGRALIRSELLGMEPWPVLTFALAALLYARVLYSHLLYNHLFMTGTRTWRAQVRCATEDKDARPRRSKKQRADIFNGLLVKGFKGDAISYMTKAW